MKRKRVWELDFARGFAIIMMIWDHLMFDLKDMDYYFKNFDELNRSGFLWVNQFAETYWNSTVRFYGHFFFVSVFLIVSGISFTFSKSNLNRSIKLLIVAALISIITYAIEAFSGLDAFIIFGIIHMFAFSIFLTYLFRKIWNNDIFIFTVGVGIVLIGFILKFWQFEYVPKLTWDVIPYLLLGTKAYGADYFGLFPYWGMIMIGTVIGNVFYKNKVTLIPSVEPSRKNIVMITGRNSLLVFITHQFVLYAIIFLVGFLFGYRFI